MSTSTEASADVLDTKSPVSISTRGKALLTTENEPAGRQAQTLQTDAILSVGLSATADDGVAIADMHIA
jgi:hypothetical protein